MRPREPGASVALWWDEAKRRNERSALASEKDAIDDLKRAIAHLRGKGGCREEAEQLVASALIGLGEARGKRNALADLTDISPLPKGINVIRLGDE